MFEIQCAGSGGGTQGARSANTSARRTGVNVGAKPRHKVATREQFESNPAAYAPRRVFADGTYRDNGGVKRRAQPAQIFTDAAGRPTVGVTRPADFFKANRSLASQSRARTKQRASRAAAAARATRNRLRGA